MDCKVETTEDLDSILQFVTNPDEGIVEFPEHDQEDHFGILVDTKLEAIEALVAEERDFIRGIDDVNENQKQTMKDDLKNDSKKFRNDFIRNISHAIQDLGIISFQVMRPGLADKLRKEEEKSAECCYRLENRDAMLDVARDTFEILDFLDNLDALDNLDIFDKIPLITLTTLITF